MKVSEWIDILEKQNPNAEVILHQWTNRSLFSPLGVAVTQKYKRAFIVRAESLMTRVSISALLFATGKKVKK